MNSRYYYIVTFVLGTIFGIYFGSRHNSVETPVDVNDHRFESTAGPELCVPCLFVDEEGGTSTPYRENVYSKTEKDADGRPKILFHEGESESLHIPMIKGFEYEDNHGVSLCKPCRDAKDEEALDVCNKGYAYTIPRHGEKPEDMIKPEDVNEVFHTTDSSNVAPKSEPEKSNHSGY